MVAVQQPLIEPPIAGAEGELERVRADPLHGDHGHRAVACNTADQRTRRDILKSDAHLLRTPLFELKTRTRSGSECSTWRHVLPPDSRRADRQLRLQLALCESIRLLANAKSLRYPYAATRSR